jgi:hypothetical protein
LRLTKVDFIFMVLERSLMNKGFSTLYFETINVPYFFANEFKLFIIMLFIFNSNTMVKYYMITETCTFKKKSITLLTLYVVSINIVVLCCLLQNFVKVSFVVSFAVVTKLSNISN